MKQWFLRVARRSVLVGLLLAVAGFAAGHILRRALVAMGGEPGSGNGPLILGATLGGAGFVLAIVFEIIALAWNALRGRTQPPAPPPPPENVT